jgi:hypothetical protein
MSGHPRIEVDKDPTLFSALRSDAIGTKRTCPLCRRCPLMGVERTNGDGS